MITVQENVALALQKQELLGFPFRSISRTLFEFVRTVARAVIGEIEGEFTYMKEMTAFDHKRLRQPLSIWIVQICLFTLLWIMSDDASWQVHAIILIAILSNSYDFLRKLFTMTRAYDRQRNNKE